MNKKSLSFHLQVRLLEYLIHRGKYSSGHIEITFEGSTLSVKDSGPGIEDSVLNKIGSPFNRGPRLNGDQSQSGLGLAWISAICQRYNWKLDIKSSKSGSSILVIFT